MKRIDISTPKYPNTFTLVDEADFEWLNQWKWFPYERRTKGKFYVITQINRVNVRMHRLILGLKKGEMTDHRNGNGLDNQRMNLRKCTRNQNAQNVKKKEGYTSKFKGVYWDKQKKKWSAGIWYMNRQIRLGYFNSEIEAAKIYDKKAREVQGEFAWLNFPNVTLAPRPAGKENNLNALRGRK